MKATLPPLTYQYNALVPFIDEETMHIHHDKHHQLYVDKCNAVCEKHPDISMMSIEDMLKSLESLNIPESDKKMIRNHGGGHLNHSLFWAIMGPNKEIDQELVKEITNTFGSTANFKELFTTTALNVFGSGWAWLARDSSKQLHVYGLPNQDSPYLQGHTPVIGIDVWEHAYYLKYQNRRAEYVENWWNVLKLI